MHTLSAPCTASVLLSALNALKANILVLAFNLLSPKALVLHQVLIAPSVKVGHKAGQKHSPTLIRSFLLACAGMMRQHTLWRR